MSEQLNNRVGIRCIKAVIEKRDPKIRYGHFVHRALTNSCISCSCLPELPFSCPKRLCRTLRHQCFFQGRKYLQLAQIVKLPEKKSFIFLYLILLPPFYPNLYFITIYAYLHFRVLL